MVLKDNSRRPFKMTPIITPSSRLGVKFTLSPLSLTGQLYMCSTESRHAVFMVLFITYRFCVRPLVNKTVCWPKLQLLTQMQYDHVCK